MSKEYLEALNYVWDNYYTEELTQAEDEKIIKHLFIVESALNRLEAIDNTEPSEALECLERICVCARVTGLYKKEDEDVVKQALLKAQEPKQYLKWEDLETDTCGVRVDLKVSLNGTKYRLSYFPNDTLKLLTNDEDFYLEIESKQFFNDLHLEVVEE